MILAAIPLVVVLSNFLEPVLGNAEVQQNEQRWPLGRHELLIPTVSFENYDKMSKELCSKSEELARAVEKQKAAQKEVDTQKTICQVQQENFELRLKLFMGEMKANATLELQECRMQKQPSQASPLVIAHLVKLKTGSFYFLSEAKANWFMAVQQCKAYGLELASIETKEDHEGLVEILDMGSTYWISGTNLGSEGAFYWASTGKSMDRTFQRWDVGQPDNHEGKEHCVHYHEAKGKATTYDLDETSLSPEFTWNDNVCNRQMRYICKAK